MCGLFSLFVVFVVLFFFFFKQKTAYEMRISDWSSDVCSSDLEITEEQSGSLDGRTYADRSGSTKLEFDDDGRAYFTQAGGQTIVAPYEEDGETRVLVTLPQDTVVFTREGRWLVGGPLQLQRTDDMQ